jgi:hypothetical protein
MYTTSTERGHGNLSNSMQFTSQSVQYPLKFIITIIIYVQSAYNSTNTTVNFRVKTHFKGGGECNFG